jgi:hypothetical protein
VLLGSIDSIGSIGNGAFAKHGRTVSAWLLEAAPHTATPAKISVFIARWLHNGVMPGYDPTVGLVNKVF